MTRIHEKATQNRIVRNRTRVFKQLLEMLTSCHTDDYATQDFTIDKIAKELLTMSARSVGTEPDNWANRTHEALK